MEVYVVDMMPPRDESPFGRDSVSEAQCLMGWLSLAFGAALLVGPPTSTAVDILDNYAPIWAWTGAFWSLGLVTFFSALFGTYRQRFWLELVKAGSWGLVLAVYLHRMLEKGFMYPVGFFACVLMAFCIYEATKLWRWSRG